jgi:ABC-type transport system involved in cytochrome c biogenesis permease subunit
MNPAFARHFHWIVLGVASLYLAFVLIPPSDPEDEIQILEFGRLPVQDGGRIKPMDSLARNNLMVISGRQTLYDAQGQAHDPSKWLLDTMTMSRMLGNPTGYDHPIFRIENDQVLSNLGLPQRSGYRYSMAELLEERRELGPSDKESDDPREGARYKSAWDVLERQYGRIAEIDESKRDLVDNKMFELGNHAELVIRLQSLQTRVVPPPQGRQDWLTLPVALSTTDAEGNPNADAELMGTMLQSYSVASRSESNPTRKAAAVKEFNDALGKYKARLNDRYPHETSMARFEAAFNHFAPFYQCTLLYVCIFLLTCVGWVTFTEPMNRAAFWLTALTLTVHSFALVGRMYIQGRPPVTNLYASSVFIGWGAVGLCLVLEGIFKNGLANAVGSVMGFLTCIIAHFLATTGDTLGMMQAVLDTNFWLATHVTCVTLGYTATFVTGFFGIATIVRGVISIWQPLDRATDRSLTQMTYGVCCFATFLSFVGTVLGGIWADQSWGRFWGWDPKENGALLIVIWNALLLHARWGGMVKGRGLAVLAVGGNIVTAWSWFGTNMLGIGLHSYGFMDKALGWLVAFVVSQLLLIGVGMVAPETWRRLWYGWVGGKPAADRKPEVPAPEALAPVPQQTAVTTTAPTAITAAAPVPVPSASPAPQLPHRKGKGKRGRR